jgi:RNA 3'-terminal phosphate cyclase (ATP)
VDQVLAYLAASPAAVDPHSADQLLLPLAFADGPSVFTVTEVTSHLLTNIAVIRHFLDRQIAGQGEEGKPGMVTIT